MGRSAEAFIKRLSILLAPRGATVALAEKTGLSRATIDHWLHRRRVPDLDQLDLAADALERDPASMISQAEERPWARVPAPLLEALAQVDPSHYLIIQNFLESFTIEHEASKIAKGLEESRGSRKKRSK